MTDARRRLGAHGEELAARWYDAAGYEVIDRNWRCASGEIDLVCRRGGVLVICEVKTRSTSTRGSPVDAVTAAKRARLRRLAAQWLRAHPVRARVVRFDVAAVVGDEVTVMTDDS